MNRPELDKIVVVTRKTALDELIERFGTRDQARFYVEKMGLDFDQYQDAHDTYQASVQILQDALPSKVRNQWIDRGFLPRFLFGGKDLIVTLGQDGLVVNTAKYLSNQPVLAFNPDPERFDGVLLPFSIDDAARSIENALAGTYPVRRVSMARARLNNGQELYAVNDLFIGHKSHGSARYRLEFDDGDEETEPGEEQSSSGIIVSTGAGSTGWLSSIRHGAFGVAGYFMSCADSEKLRERSHERMDWESEDLVYTVREPFVSRTSAARIVHGSIIPGQRLVLTSRMPQSGVIFSDGVEDDYLPFNSGAVAEIGIADRKLHLYVRWSPSNVDYSDR
jgi:NAD kinase